MSRRISASFMCVVSHDVVSLTTRRLHHVMGHDRESQRGAPLDRIVNRYVHARAEQARIGSVWRDETCFCIDDQYFMYMSMNAVGIPRKTSNKSSNLNYIAN